MLCSTIRDVFCSCSVTMASLTSTLLSVSDGPYV
jgi:hypothetical protein